MKGKQLRAIRGALGMTQVELAKALRVNPNTVARWERDERVITEPMSLLIQKVAAEHKRR